MKNKKMMKIIGMYFITMLISLLLFFPVDIIIYGDSIIDNIYQYLITNISTGSICVLIFTISVKFFNSNFWRGKVIIRIIIEIFFALLVVNITLFLFQNILVARINLKNYIYIIINDKYFFASSIEGLFFIFIVEIIYLYNKKKDGERERERFKYIQLKNQLNPHFLFNSLNILSAMGYTQTPKEIATYTSKLANVYRYILSNDDKNIITLKEELQFIYQYVDIINARFSNNLLLNINIDNDDEEKKILLMTLQLLIENAVKHNIVSQNEPLIINIYSEQGYIVVSNNINKREIPYASTGIGLKNLNERYSIIANKKIIIINKDNNFTVKAPLI